MLTGGETTISYFGRAKEAREDCKLADIQLDGHEGSNTSPVLHGSTTAGMAPMSGPNNFTKERHRPEFVGNRKPGSGFRREFPTEGVSK